MALRVQGSRNYARCKLVDNYRHEKLLHSNHNLWMCRQRVSCWMRHFMSRKDKSSVRSTSVGAWCESLTAQIRHVLTVSKGESHFAVEFCSKTRLLAFHISRDWHSIVVGE